MLFRSYDQSLDVIHVGSDDFLIKFEKNIEPDIMNIFDLNLQEDTEN